MNIDKVVDCASFIVLNKDNFVPVIRGRKDEAAKFYLDKLSEALKESPNEIEIPAERLEILE